jgi:DNA primase
MGERQVTRVERVLGRLGIVIEERRGQRLWALCPYHKDRHAENWFIRHTGPRRGQHHCFACKAGGSLLELVEHVRRCDRDKARAWLKDFADDAAPPAAGRIRVEVSSPFAGGFELPAELIVEPFKKWVSGARSYAKSRDITLAQVKKWRIGYAVEGRLAGRLIFVARDTDGVPSSYSARTFVDAKKRYLTPDSREGADLDVMFGEEHWPAPDERGKRPGFVVLVEGAINGLAVERALVAAGVEGYFAVMGGSHLRPIHAMKLASFERVLLLSDPDAAGDDVAELYDAALARHTAVERVRLPAGSDAQSVSLDELVSLLCPERRPSSRMQPLTNDVASSRPRSKQPRATSSTLRTGSK